MCSWNFTLFDVFISHIFGFCISFGMTGKETVYLLLVTHLTFIPTLCVGELNTMQHQPLYFRPLAHTYCRILLSYPYKSIRLSFFKWTSNIRWDFSTPIDDDICLVPVPGFTFMLALMSMSSKRIRDTSHKFFYNFDNSWQTTFKEQNQLCWSGSWISRWAL